MVLPNQMQGQAADVQSPTPMLEAHWETVHQHSSILFFKQAVLCMQVRILASCNRTCYRAVQASHLHVASSGCVLASVR